MGQHSALPYLRNSENGRIVSPAEAVLPSRDGDAVATGFLRIKLGEALERGVTPHTFKGAEEAQSDWRNIEGISGPPKPRQKVPTRERRRERPDEHAIVLRQTWPQPERRIAKFT